MALALVTIVALSLRWYYVSTALVVHPVRGDAVQYVNYAWNLLTHHTFSKDAPGSAFITPDNYRDPGFPTFLAVLMSIFGTGDAWYAAVLLSQALLGALTVTFATQLGAFWLPRRWAFGAGLLMAVWPHSVSINGFLLSETLFGFFCALGLLMLAKACGGGNRWMGVATGVTLSLAALTNAILLPFGIFLAAFFWWRKLAPRNVCIALAIGASVLPVAWAIRNSQLVPSSSGESSLDRAFQNFAYGTSPDNHAAYRASFFSNAAEMAKARAVLQNIDQEYALLKNSPQKGFEAFSRQVAAQPAKYLFWYFLEKPHELWEWNIVIGQGDIYVYPTVNSPFVTQRVWIALEAICQALNPLLIPLMVGGIFFGSLPSAFTAAFGNTANRGALMAIICMSVFITLVYSLLQAEPRYSIPFRPMEILLATTALAGALRSWRNRTSSIDQASRSRPTFVFDAPPQVRQPQP